MSEIPRRRSARLGALLAAFLLCLAVPAPAGAQYFGQNKVQYDDFHFEVLETPHFDIYYYPTEADAARDVSRMAERWYARLGSLLDWQLSGRQAVVLYASHPEFEQTNVVEGLISEGTGGVTEGLQRRIVLPLAASLGDTDHVLGHELVHAFQYDILDERAGGMPLWFMEGMAEYLSVGPRDPQTAMWLRDALAADRLPSVDDLEDPRYFPYRFGQAFWAYIGGRWGDETIGNILRGLAPQGATRGATGVSATDAVEAATGLTGEELSQAWHDAIAAQYEVTPRPKDTDADAPVPDTVLAGERTDSGSLNVGPALSPDGTRIAYLSSRNRLSVDLYVADAATGQVLRQLTKTAVDPHFESLQFLQSAGSWAPDNRRLVVATVRSGRGALTIFDTDTGRVVREIPLAQRGEAFSPSWSPDGRQIAFTAQVGGFTDLYLCDLATGHIRQLTDDPFADLQPAWSPDGTRLVFATDRFTSRLDSLDFGAFRLALMDLTAPATPTVTAVTSTLGGDLFSPAWAPDGRRIFAVGTPTGRPEVYEVSLDRDQATRLTDVETGVSGVTRLSPALSVSRDGGRSAYSVFRDDGYEIRFLRPADAAAPSAVPQQASATDLALLPPADRTSSRVASALRDSGELAAASQIQERPYHANLSLVAVGQQYGGATGGSLGTYFSGGVSFLFSDLLGNHTLLTGVDVNGTARDIGGQAAYVDRSHRWNWGVFGDRVPIRTGFAQAGSATVDGQDVYVEATDLQRQTYTTLGGLVAYPFSRALRLELSGAAQRISFDEEVTTSIFDPVTGNQIAEQTDRPTPPDALTLVQASAALVRDTTAFGATGPILGQRFRLEATPTTGDLSYTSVTADFRQYVMPVRPLTLAGRAVHLARYGGSGEDQRLVPLYLGYPTLVRGYDANTFDAGECTPTDQGTCAEFDRLLGSRALVFNAEARMPLLGFTGNLNYGPIPTELFGFFDAGVAWTQQTSPSLIDGGRDWVRSVGVGARVNLFGYAIAEFNLVRPLDRPTKGWMYVFNLRPGF